MSKLPIYFVSMSWILLLLLLLLLLLWHKNTYFNILVCEIDFFLFVFFSFLVFWAGAKVILLRHYCCCCFILLMVLLLMLLLLRVFYILSNTSSAIFMQMRLIICRFSPYSVANDLSLSVKLMFLSISYSPLQLEGECERTKKERFVFLEKRQEHHL